MPGPLDGIKVLDITRGLNGPCCGVWLSDYGAEVIKIKPRLTGEMGRQATPIPNYEFTPYFTCANDPQAQENGYIIELDLPGLGLTKLAGTPAVLSETPAKAQGAPPKLGEHTEEVLTSLGYSRDEITAFREEEVI